MQKNRKRFSLWTTLTAAVLLLCWAVMILVLDPFFHYHMPLFGMQPVVYDERYQNAGVAERFDYDAVIIGSSMTENFSTAWMDETFDCRSVKLTYSAARTGAYAKVLEKAFATRPVKKVFLGLDNASLIAEHGTYMFPLPEYLYDSDVCSDAEYLWNLDVLAPAARQVWHNLRGTVPPLSEAYSWDEPGICSRERALASVEWDMLRQESQTDVTDYPANCRENMEQDLLPLINAHPETEFYVFYPPYSILQWNMMWNRGELDARLEVTALAMELLGSCGNVRQFYFQNDRDVVCDLDNYKDYSHYSAEVNRQMVDWMAEGRGLVTPQNRDELIADTREMALKYDYAALLS